MLRRGLTRCQGYVTVNLRDLLNETTFNCFIKVLNIPFRFWDFIGSVRIFSISMITYVSVRLVTYLVSQVFSRRVCYFEQYTIST